MICWIASLELATATALVQRLAEKGQGHPFYEHLEANPFAARADQRELVRFLCTALLLQERGFQEAMAFAGRPPGIGRRRKPSPPGGRQIAICNSHPLKAVLEAEFALSLHEHREVVRSLYRHLCIPDPDVVVYLHAAPDVVIARLRQQQPDVDVRLVTRACEAYEDFFRRYQGEKVDLDTTSLQFIDAASMLASILGQVPFLYDCAPAKGTSLDGV